MAILGGSPLGLIGLRSIANPNTGRSTFNGGLTRNVDVYDYNRSRAGSLFTGQRRLRAWPNISGKMTPEDSENKILPEDDITGTADVIYNNDSIVDGYTSPFDGNDWKNGVKTHMGQNVLHNNDVYDTSVLNIIEKLSPTKGALKPSDFAYLKNLGVYPNNRLMICRRFMTPTADNIMVNNISKDGKTKDIPSLATMISWIPEGDNFIEITFGEVWEEAKADFTSILNSLGEDWGKTGVGGIASAAANAVPLPGFTEIFQRQFLAKLGLLESQSANSIPAGNPNLIKEAKVRKTIGYGDAGSGLIAKVSVKMICEYELKFISGIDPTIVWMDILGTIVRFGTSNSSNYGLSQKVAAKISKWSRDPNSLLVDVINSVRGILDTVKSEMVEGLEKIKEGAVKVAADIKKETETTETKGAASTTPTADDVYNKAVKVAKDAQAAGVTALNTLVSAVKKSINGSIMKYRVQVMGIVSALTGNPSTPWHLTVGNPLRPVFCSGDMYVSDTTLKLGPILAFNDLPSTITVEFTVTNARSWGMQEIMAKFNSGYLRTVDIQKTFFETNGTFKDGKFISDRAGVLPGSVNSTFESTTSNTGTTASTPLDSGATPIDTTGATSSNTGDLAQTKQEGGEKPV